MSNDSQETPVGSSSLESARPLIVVAGARGMLGTDLVRHLERARFRVTGLHRPEFDITNSDGVFSCFEDLGPRLVINCAAYTAVDRAEQESDLTFAANRDGPMHLADACRRLGIPLIHISTDYVFDGTAHQPYKESDAANPVGVYAESKWEGEQAIRARWEHHLIVRTAWLFGVKGNNFVKTILRLAKERDEIRVVDDQYGCPTWTRDLARALTAMTSQVLEKGRQIEWGTYHCCGAGQTSWHGFAERIVQEGRRRTDLKDVRVVPITTAEYPTPVKRPAWSVLDCSKIERVFKFVPRPWQMGLADMLEELFE